MYDACILPTYFFLRKMTTINHIVKVVSRLYTVCMVCVYQAYTDIRYIFYLSVSSETFKYNSYQATARNKGTHSFYFNHFSSNQNSLMEYKKQCNFRMKPFNVAVLVHTNTPKHLISSQSLQQNSIICIHYIH